MVAPIDGISAAPLPVAPAPAPAPTAPLAAPDLRDTQAGVTAAQAAGEVAQLKDAKARAGGEKELEDAINERVARLLGSNIRLRIELDKGSGDFVYKSVNKDTGEVERQWPAETVLRMLAFFRELDGLLFDQKA
jgi:flagellar protein FlaG